MRDRVPTLFDFPGCVECKRLCCRHQIERVERARMKQRRTIRRRNRRRKTAALPPEHPTDAERR